MDIMSSLGGEGVSNFVPRYIKCLRFQMKFVRLNIFSNYSISGSENFRRKRVRNKRKIMKMWVNKNQQLLNQRIIILPLLCAELNHR